MTKSLVLIRHGQRDMDADEPDNGLNARGLDQARAVADFFGRRFPDGVPGLTLLSSPKRRCRETIAAISSIAGVAASVDPNLDEHRAGESSTIFDRRVQTFLDERRRASARLTIACGHGDWLPFAIEALTGQRPDLPNCCWYEIDWRGGPAELAWFIPTFEPFRTRS